MSQAISIPFHRPARRARGRGHFLFLRAVVVVIAGALGLAIAMSTVDVGRAALAGETASVEPLAAIPDRPLPPEWRWKPKPLDVRHMYRQGASPRLDWIRNGGAR
jgi:hypothetical protein